MLTRSKQIAKLERRHRALDTEIAALQSGQTLQMRNVTELKREKLRLKDAITKLRSHTLH